MIQNWKFQRGDIFFTRFDNAIGSEQSGNRPAVVLQNDVGNFYSPTLIVATLTSKAAKKYTQPTHCLLVNEFLSVPSIVQAEQIFTVDKSRVLKFLGHLTPEEMSRVDDAVRASLALNPMGSMTVEQEALLFAEQNGFSAPLTAGIKLRAKVVGGDAISKAFLAATNRVGLSLNYDSQQLTDYRIGCVGTAFRLYKQMGEPLYCETMRLIVAAWEGKPDSFRASVLKGMMHFVELYHGEFSEERLVRALGSIHPVDIYRIGQDDPAKLRGWKKYVFPIYTAYNGKCRKDALPMKF